MESEKVRFFISCVPGLEKVLEIEARQIGLIPLSSAVHVNRGGATIHGEDSGGLSFEGYFSHIQKSNLYLRTANRVIVRLGEFHAAAFSELRKRAARFEWERYIKPGQSVDIRVACHKSKLYHTKGVADRVLGAINDHFKLSSKPCEQQEGGQMVLARLVNDKCTISIDSSGEPLHKRGYRQAVAKAPLRETLAAAMLIFSQWNGQTPLIDPFCGSGTIPIEAALLARRIPPGITRQFAFFQWPQFSNEDWQILLEDAKNKIIPLNCSIQGYDRDRGAIDMAESNASRAGQKNEISFLQQAISLLEIKDNPGWIITNPPYGIRVGGNKDLRDLYARFGEVLKVKCRDWKVGILCNDPSLTGNLGMEMPVDRLLFSNGGISVQYSVFQIN